MEGRSLGDVPRRLAGLLATGGASELRVERLAPSLVPRRAAAVDGSSGVLLEGAGLIVGAERAGFVLVESDGRSERVVGSTRVGLFARESELPRAREASEEEAARAALGRLAAGDVLLLDGGMRPTHAALVEIARAKGVDVVAVAKSSSRTLAGDVPVFTAARRAARAAGLAREPWLAPLPLALPFASDFVARLHPVEGWAFLFSVASAEPRAVLARVAALASHPAYAGYPSPLAMAHNSVLLTEEAQRELALRVREDAESLGADREAWDLAFTDYHDILELGA